VAGHCKSCSFGEPEDEEDDRGEEEGEIEEEEDGAKQPPSRHVPTMAAKTLWNRNQ